MLNMIVDTSTKWIYIGFVQDDKILAESQFVSIKEHSANFLYVLNSMLKANDLEIADFDNLYCGFGPGSYTGLRIGVTVLKMFAAFKHNKLYAVSSLYLAASGYDNKNVAVLFDARRDNYFCALYGEKEIPDRLRNIDEFMNQLEGLEDLKIVYEDDFKVNPLKAMKKGVLIENVDEFVPNYLRISEAEYNLLNDKKS